MMVLLPVLLSQTFTGKPSREDVVEASGWRYRSTKGVTTIAVLTNTLTKETWLPSGQKTTFRSVLRAADKNRPYDIYTEVTGKPGFTSDFAEVVLDQKDSAIDRETEEVDGIGPKLDSTRLQMWANVSDIKRQAADLYVGWTDTDWQRVGKELASTTYGTATTREEALSSKNLCNFV